MRPRITKTKVAAYLLLILAVVLGVGLFVTQSRKDKGKEMYDSHDPSLLKNRAKIRTESLS